jgi:pimeloyl-ACP methyl ester carboxylesterase
MALAYALANPDSSARLILVGSAPSWSVAERDIEMWDEDPDRAFRENLDCLFSPTTDAAVRSAYDRQLRHTLPASCKADLEACRSFALDDRLGAIRAPSLVVYGSDEFWKDGSLALAAGLPKVRSVVVSDAGHAIAWEKPAELAAAIRDFVTIGLAAGRRW